MRTRLWESHEGSSTCVQFRDDTRPMVFVHSNIGWLPIRNAPTSPGEAEKFAKEIADGYHLEESSLRRALFMADVDPAEYLTMCKERHSQHTSPESLEMLVAAQKLYDQAYSIEEDWS